MLERPGFVKHDQWQVQIQAIIRRRARVFLKNAVLDAAAVRGSWLEPVDDVRAMIDSLLSEAGPGARVAVLPQGPQTVPYHGDAA